MDDSVIDYVTLVDDADNDVGVAEKMEAHQAPGMLHRAISVFLFDQRDRVLLQQRAEHKHHFRGLWANTCCSHPRPGEDVVAAGRRRLMEEMGCDVHLEAVGTFTYRAEDPLSGLVEHERDHVLVGLFDGEPRPNPAEVQAHLWTPIEVLQAELVDDASRYAPWLMPALAVALGGEQIRRS